MLARPGLVALAAAVQIAAAVRLKPKPQPNGLPANMNITHDVICAIRNGTIKLPAASRPESNWSNDFGKDEWDNGSDSWVGHHMVYGPQWVSHSNPTGHIPVFVFDRAVHSHMRDVVFKWGSDEGKLQHHTLGIALEGRLSKNAVQKAFTFLKIVQPTMAIWLLPFTTGDYEGVMHDGMLQDVLNLTNARTRHGVFLWPPEFCDQGYLTHELIHRNLESADFVFQFGYQDERLARRNSSKFLPWPLGPAWWKGWEKPSGLAPVRDRGHLAAFRGCNVTHCDLARLMRLMVGSKDVLVEDSGDWQMFDTEASRSRYREVLANSSYSLQLPGNNPNCYRVVEAVESGSIPVVVTSQRFGCYDNWSAVYGIPTGTRHPWIPRAPFLVLESWDHLPSRLADMAAGLLEDAADAELAQWYSNWRAAFKRKLQEKIRDSMALQGGS